MRWAALAAATWLAAAAPSPLEDYRALLTCLLPPSQTCLPASSAKASYHICASLCAVVDYNFTRANVTLPRTSLRTRERELLLGDQPLLVRGVTYSPTPIGKDMSASEASQRVYDFFTEGSSDLWRRDLPLMREAGINSVRVYELRAGNGQDHTAFLDAAYLLNITVFAGFPLDESMDLISGNAASSAALNPLNVNLADVKDRLRTAVLNNAHPAIGMWLVGNEVNLAENRFVCNTRCKFQVDTEHAYTVMNELCGVVAAEGYLCTSPLADVPLPASRYLTSRTGWEDFTAHVRLLDSRMTNFHVWMVCGHRSNSRAMLPRKPGRPCPILRQPWNMGAGYRCAGL